MKNGEFLTKRNMFRWLSVYRYPDHETQQQNQALLQDSKHYDSGQTKSELRRTPTCEGLRTGRTERLIGRDRRAKPRHFN